MKKFTTISVICIGVLIYWQLGRVEMVSAQGNMEKHGGKLSKCKIAGTWRAETSFLTYIPLEPNGRRFSLVSGDPIPEVPVFSGVPAYKEAEAVTPLQGILVKVSPNLYRFTASQIIVDGEREKLGEVEVSGETKFIDCDHRVAASTIKLLDADGELIFCFSFQSQVERFKLAPPCEELPPFPVIDE